MSHKVSHIFVIFDFYRLYIHEKSKHIYVITINQANNSDFGGVADDCLPIDVNPT